MDNSTITVFGICGYSIFMEVENFHKKEETLISNTIHEEIGSKGFNQALTISKQGLNVNFISSVGDDVFSKIVKDEFKKYKINYYIKEKPGKTAFACILTNSKGDNQVTVYPGVKLELLDLDFKEIEDLVKKSSLVLLQLEIPNEINFRIIEIAKKYKVKVILNPAPSKNFSEEYFRYELLMTPNECEVKEIFKIDDLNDYEILKKKFKTKGVQEIVITLGSKGVLVYDGDFKKIKTDKVKAIDTTGAGDVFNGMLAYMLVKEESLYNAALMASKAATTSVLKKYVLEAIPSLEDIKNK
ncbi:MAG: PfkB family carbohydrate kinase [Bacilli bacterium]|nr:PfkB family carbohydrate kinase [Bacilli bacterium]